MSLLCYVNTLFCLRLKQVSYSKINNCFEASMIFRGYKTQILLRNDSFLNVVNRSVYIIY